MTSPVQELTNKLTYCGVACEKFNCENTRLICGKVGQKKKK